ncbi:uncharacterized protein LOC134326522 [Trichomycterus rosablanca]|uniref:uncharacterized protein LOC134326522 n=1 Tax=Trichomycterus rosablanca TaxID=2290929 RepID=UPI002F357139
MVILKFSNGSIVTESNLQFTNTTNATSTNITDVKNTFLNATANDTSLNVISSSVNVTENPISKLKVFFSINENFDSNLSSNTSSQFIAKAKTLTDKFEPALQKKFSSFLRMVVVQFTNGSIKTESSLEFSTNTTNITDLTKALNDTIQNNPALNIIASTLTVNSGYKAGMFGLLALLWMCLVSLLLPEALHH